MNKCALILVALCLLCGSLFGQNSNTPSPASIGVSTTGNVISLTGAGTTWTGSPFTLHGGCGAALTAQSVSTATAASVTLTAGTCAGNLYITDGGTTEAIVTVMKALTLGQPFVVNGSTGNVIALTRFGGTAWTAGTPGSPTFALSGCPTASITAQSVASTMTANVTVSGGGTDCTVTVTDPSNSTTAAFGVYTRQNWYIRTDGGTRYSTNMTSGQCDGKGDAAYPGTGVNQHCAFNDYRYLYQDGSYANGTAFPAWGWVIKGGDNVIIRGSIGTSVSYRVGGDLPGVSYCGGAGGICWGLAGDATDSFNPPVPAGIASQHTRILGENYANCAAQSARTQLHGGTALYFVLDLRATSYVDAQCLDITDFSNCSTPAGTCTGSSDYASNGVRLYADSLNITLKDVWAHGLSYSGIGGPPGTGFTATDLGIIGNGGAGWNADPGDGTTGYGTLNVTNFNISWNGCEEEYPVVHALPYAYCRDDSFGGYGDGFGTTTVGSPSPGWQIHFDQGTVSYNTQDGLDALHANGVGTSVSYTRVLAFGNEGQQLKVGATTNIQNSQIIGNCSALQQVIPGRPSPTNDSLGDICRAANTAVAIVTYPGQPSVFQANTLMTGGAIGVEVEYATSNTGSTNTLLYNDNLFFGFFNSGSGSYPSPIYSTTNLNSLTNPGASWTNNSYFGQKWACPQTGESAAVCADPKLTDETLHLYGYGNMALLSGSPAIGAGVVLGSVTVDFNGVARPSPPAIGALEPGSVLSPPTNFTGVIIGQIAHLDPKERYHEDPYIDLVRRAVANGVRPIQNHRVRRERRAVHRTQPVRRSAGL